MKLKPTTWATLKGLLWTISDNGRLSNRLNWLKYIRMSSCHNCVQIENSTGWVVVIRQKGLVLCHMTSPGIKWSSRWGAEISHWFVCEENAQGESLFSIGFDVRTVQVFLRKSAIELFLQKRKIGSGNHSWLFASTNGHVHVFITKWIVKILWKEWKQGRHSPNGTLDCFQFG